MLGLLFALVTTAAPQEPVPLDVPVYRDSAYGVSLHRPFDDWVFEPASSRGTTTVIFHPRDASLREQLWGALVLTTFNRDVPLGQVADQRVLTSWHATLGPSFTLLTRDSMTVVGLPAIHVVMGGAIDHAVLDVEEYLIARGGDLILLQFRYPRGLPRDSIAAGYQRVLDGLRIRGAPAQRAAVPESPAEMARRERMAMWRALRGSPWRLQGYEALVRYDTAQPRLEVTARLDLVNDGTVSRDSVVFWVAALVAVDSARVGTGRSAVLRGGPAHRLALGPAVPPQGRVTLTVYAHITPESAILSPDVRLTRDEAMVLDDWVPRVQSPVDSGGQYEPVPRPRQMLRFDLPATHRVVASGRLASEVAALDRRRMTWVADDAAAGGPAFAIARYRLESREAGRLRLRFFLLEGSGASRAVNDSLVALIARGWSFYARAFGPLESFDIAIAEAPLDGVRGLPGVLFVNRSSGLLTDSSGGAVRALSGPVFRELARSWWGGTISAAGPGSTWIVDGFPAWASIAARGVIEGDTVRQRLVREAESAWRAIVRNREDPPLASIPSDDDSSRAILTTKGAAALEAARRAVGDARFREAIRTFTAQHRAGWARIEDLFPLLGSVGTTVLQPYLFGTPSR